MTVAVDHTKPEAGESWRFDQDVAAVFDDMLARSIPDYETMREIVFAYGSRFVADGTYVVDYGCSLGRSLEPFIDRFGARVRYVGIDNSSAMLDVARRRLPLVEAGYVDLREEDLSTYFPPKPVSLTLSIFSLQFVSAEDRAAVLRRIHEATIRGGALVLAEKVLGSDALAQTTLVDEYHALKSRNGYSDEEIRAKARALRGVLVPLSAAENERALRAAGFETVELVWRAHNFATWLAIRGR
jgi:tRNA (cmo5U34)-methyltransferase